jgi:hypothetical protein
MLPNLQLSVYCALTTFETGISPWMHPSEWLDANTKHIHSIFNGIVDLTENADIKAVRFPATIIFQVCYPTFRLSKVIVLLIVPQRLMVYIMAHNILCSSDKMYFFFRFASSFVSSNVITSLLGKFNVTLKKCQDWDILNLMRNQGNIKNELLTLFRNASPVCLHPPFFFISVLNGIFRNIVKCSLRTFLKSCLSWIQWPCQQMWRSSSQMRTLAKNLLKLRVLERSRLSIFFMLYVYELSKLYYLLY